MTLGTGHRSLVTQPALAQLHIRTLRYHGSPVTFQIPYLSAMELPRFLLADHPEDYERLYVLHTEYPRFVWDVSSDEVEWFDHLEGEEEELVQEVGHILEEARQFYESELDKLENED